MNKDIIMEAEFFLSSFFWGILLLFLYDCIRIFRGVKYHIWLAVATEDILFWGVAGIFVFRMIYERNYGIIRAYAILGMLLGMWLYFSLISNWFVLSTIRLIKKTGHLVIKVLYCFTTPFRYIYDKMQKQLSKISKFLRKRVDKIRNRIKRCLKNILNRYKIKKNEKRQKKLDEKIRKLALKKSKKMTKEELQHKSNELEKGMQKKPKEMVLERIMKEDGH